jgi:hypothetical protein
MNANPAVTEHRNYCIFNGACMHLRGEVGISVLSLFLTENNAAVKTFHDGWFPIYWAACHSSLDVFKFLYKFWPESVSIVGRRGRSVLHVAVADMNSDTADVAGKVQYICDQCTALIHLKGDDGDTPLNNMITNGVTNEGRFNFECVQILCNVDTTVVRDTCTSDTTYQNSSRFPLHILLDAFSSMSEVSDEADCFRLFLSLYPAAASIEDDNAESPHDLAVAWSMSTYFIRMLLAADPTIDPVRRHNSNFVARREGLFLAFKALSSDVEPTIWVKMRLRGRDLIEHVISYL